MSEQNEIPAAEAGTITAATALLDGLFGGAPAPAESPPPAPAPQAAATPQEAPPAEPPAPQTTPAEEPGLATIIRQQRLDRQARQAKERESADLSVKLQVAEAQLAKMGKTDMLGDPIGFAQAHGLSEQEMALIGQAYLYHLVPDKAPPDLRYKMLEAKTAREARAREAQREQETVAQANASAVAKVQQYTETLGASVQTWDVPGAAHPFPASQTWFGGNHSEYAESLVHTARNLAESARDRGEVADLSPKAVAAALEQDLASRASRFRAPPAAAPTQQRVEAVQPAGGKQSAVLSTKGQGGTPLPKATTEEERIQRAIAAAFPTR